MGDPRINTRSKICATCDPHTIVHVTLHFEGDPRNIVLSTLDFEGDPQNIVRLKPYFHTKKHYRNVVNSVLNTEQI